MKTIGERIRNPLPTVVDYNAVEKENHMRNYVWLIEARLDDKWVPLSPIYKHRKHALAVAAIGRVENKKQKSTTLYRTVKYSSEAHQ